MGEVASVVGGGTPATSERDYWGGPIPWITPADLSGFDGKFIGRGARSITERGLAESGARMLPAGTVLMSSRAPVGYVAIASSPVSTNQGFKSFVLRDDLLPDYVYWYLKGHRDLVRSFASGTTFAEVSGRRAAEIPIPVPPLAEQRSIVAFVEEHLSDLDAARTGLARARANLQRLEGAVTEWALRSALESEGCGVAKLSTLATDSGYGTSQKCEYDADGPPVIRIPNVVDGGLVLDDLKFATRRGELSATEALAPGDLLVVRTNGSRDLIGRGAVVTRKPETPTFFASYLIRYRLRDDPVLWRWLACIWHAPSVRAVLTERAASSAGQYNLSVAKLDSVELPVPSAGVAERLSREVDARVAAARRLSAELRLQIRRAEHLRHAILTRAFAGRSKLISDSPADDGVVATVR